ncbi:MAG: BREX-1 system adenine-specific DNA-methyltransferase PglX, partial [Treponema sp.]|nr:BREX-1 system adenine-specific DNA-methyltransferase PglX [Treponema sp.]
MSFDKDTRNLLAKTVAACRRRLVEDVTDQLRGVFGLHPDGVVLPLEKLTHLSPDQHAAARRLRDLLDHYTAGAAGKDSDRRKAAYERMVLEISFTALNRLAALRLCEERGLVVECVRKGTTSAGFQMFERISGGALGGRYDTYRVFLECLFDELALDLGVLFDRMTPQSAVFPSERCMEDVLAELNKAELTHLWTEDETIGWVYQYFNPPEERRAMRDASAAPRNSRELAVRNQFFTPRYVVEFLTDNTLGRIWCDMRKGDTALKDECRYLVRRPNEVFLAAGEKAPPEREGRTDLSQEELLKQPVYVEHRPKKDPRDLRILDPACGSGHFLLYAFDLLERIYEEAWGDPESPKFETSGRTLQEDFETFDDLRREVPKLIMEHNQHGIDIDPRAVQIAALALWLRAQKTWKNLGIKASDRPRVAKSNIVTAEPMPGEEDMKEEFTAELKPRVLGQLVDAVFDKMKLAGEAGALLKIEEEIKNVVSEAKEQWLHGPKPEQQLLFPAMDDPKPKQQEIRFDFKGITDEGFWEQAEGRILDALRDYSEKAENGRAVMRRLFADDAARGFAFIDVCRKPYDVVLMNPPFGEVSAHLSNYLARKYPSWNKNILCAFLEQGYLMSHPHGATAAIYDRTAIVKSTYEDFRRAVLVRDNRLTSVADLGWGVLDANVEVTTSILHHMPSGDEGAFLDCREIDVDDKGAFLEGSIADFSAGSIRNGSAYASGASFAHLPNAVIGYDFPGFLISAFESFLSLENSGLKANQGFALKAEKHFRVWWEIHPDSRMVLNRMFNGAGFSPFVTSLHDIAISPVEPEDLPMDSSTRKSGIGSHRKMGICFGKRGDFFCTHILPKGHIFTVEGQSIPIANKDVAIEALGLLNTPLVRYSLNKYCGQHKYSGYVNLFPYRRLANIEGCRTRIIKVVEAIREAQCFDETQSFFSIIRPGSGIVDRASVISRLIDSTQKLRSETETFCHEQSISTYKVSQKELVEIENFRARQPNAESPISDADLATGCKWFSAHTEISLIAGILFGRWDIRIATDSALAPKLAEFFEPLPKCPPGMLAGPDGLPTESGGIVSEEWLRARPDVNTLPTKGAVSKATISDEEYPLRISWNGILVDDPGGIVGWLPKGIPQPHRDDIVRRTHEVLDLLWKDKANDIAQEACDILGVSNLREYYRKPGQFFQDHLKRYTKSRRKAPIYWPLSTASGSYTIWLYYHRLNEQTLYGAVNKYVEPKISEVERGIAQIENDLKAASGREATRLTDRLGEARAFVTELRGLREELLRIAALPYKPDLNDGVIINAAPFRDLF